MNKGNLSHVLTDLFVIVVNRKEKLRFKNLNMLDNSVISVSFSKEKSTDSVQVHFLKNVMMLGGYCSREWGPWVIILVIILVT